MPILRDVEGEIYRMKEGETREFELDYFPSAGESGALVGRFTRDHKGLSISIGGNREKQRTIKVSCFKYP